MGIGAGLAGISVAIGAFGAHGLRDVIDPQAMQLWKTAVDYQMNHALGILVLGISAVVIPEGRHPALRRSAIALLVGLGLFSGSLYALALGAPRALGIMTPVGGLALLAGWALWVVALWRR
ncbi:MAG: DUF423 domain-containing protein [Betaproteobacteria bacterium]|nr:DUF423 domain-containing protein [Betaproteobacteria bacterium]